MTPNTLRALRTTSAADVLDRLTEAGYDLDDADALTLAAVVTAPTAGERARALVEFLAAIGVVR